MDHPQIAQIGFVFNLRPSAKPADQIFLATSASWRFIFQRRISAPPRERSLLLVAIAACGFPIPSDRL
jgi:hypothetical protein